MTNRNRKTEAWGLLCLAGALLAASGCAGNRQLAGVQRVVESIPPSQPRWVEKSSFEEGGRIFYAGGMTGRHDMALGLREARGEAEKKIAEEVRQRIRTEFGRAIDGENVEGGTGSHVRDIIAKVSENVQISGVTQSEQFVQKVEERTPYGVRYLWNCYALLSLSKEDYLEARRQTLGGALAKAREERNQAAHNTLKDAFQKLEAVSVAAASAAGGPAGKAAAEVVRSTQDAAGGR